MIIRVLDFFFKNCWYMFFLIVGRFLLQFWFILKVFFWRFLEICSLLLADYVFEDFFFLLADYVVNLSWYLLVDFKKKKKKMLVDYLLCSVLMRNWVCAINFLPRTKKELLLLSVLYIFLGQCLCVKVGLEIAGYALLWSCKSCSVTVSQRKEFWFNCYCFFEWIGVSNGRGRGG